MDTPIIILISLLLSAFFSGMEIAYVSSHRMEVELEKKKSSWISKRFVFLSNHPKQFITTMLIGNTIALVVYSNFMGQWLEPGLFNIIHVSWIVLIIQTIISTLIILVVSEFVPKAIFSVYAFRLFKFFTIPALLFFWLMYPFVLITNIVTNLVLYFIDPNNKTEEKPYLKEELIYFLSEKIDETDDDQLDTEIQIFQNALNFSQIKARDCMIPRNEIQALELHQSISELTDTFLNTGLSKIIIYRDSIDNIIGYVHSFELFKNPEEIKHIILPIETVQETTNAKEIMDRLINKKRSVAIVLDEYGGTSGMLTLEDIVEELFGDIDDEFDTEDLKEEKISEEEYILSARLEIDYLNEEYNLNLPKSENYETLGGLLVDYTEDIPEVGETIEIKDFTFTITKGSSTKIEEIHLKINKE